MSANNTSHAFGPGPQDWDRFWSTGKVDPATSPSWSKRRIIKVISPFCRSGTKALDAGSGSGFFSRYFLERGMQVVSLDYSQEALASTKEFTGGRSDLLQGDLLSGQFIATIAQRFDMIFSDGLLEHFSADEQIRILENLKKLLAPNGVIITFVPNRWSPWELIRPLFMPGIQETPFVLKDLIVVHERCGLKILESGGINVVPWKLSPEAFMGKSFGMLLYVIAKAQEHKAQAHKEEEHDRKNELA